MVDYLPSKQMVWVQIPLSAIFCGDITQLVECMLCMHKVIGSNPIISNYLNNNDITQSVEYRNHNPFVVGSSPTFVKVFSECSAVGSVSVLGIEGHRFESYHSDFKTIYIYK